MRNRRVSEVRKKRDGSPARIVVSSDHHLGQVASNLSASQRDIRAGYLREEFKAVINYCLENSADALLLAGDVFDSPMPSPDDIAWVIGQLDGLHLSPQQGDELVVDYLHHLLSGCKAAEHFPTGGLVANGMEKAPGHLEVYVGFQQGTANLAQGFVDVPLRDSPLSTEFPEDVVQSLGKAVEHDMPVPRGGDPCDAGLRGIPCLSWVY